LELAALAYRRGAAMTVASGHSLQAMRALLSGVGLGLPVIGT
jgi:hypothetical protein